MLNTRNRYDIKYLKAHIRYENNTLQFCLKNKCICTEAISAVDAPSLAAVTHWLAPLPPYFFSNLVPITVSPGLGNRGEKLKNNNDNVKKTTIYNHMYKFSYRWLTTYLYNYNYITIHYKLSQIYYYFIIYIYAKKMFLYIYCPFHYNIMFNQIND